MTHQTASTANLSPEQTLLRDRMIALNPGWRHRLYTDFECREVIRRRLPRLLSVYDAYPTPIQRADLFRVAAVYVFGGVYLDLDMDCSAPLASLTGSHCVLAEEKTLSAQEADALGHAERLRIANYMFASAPGHPFWLDIMEAMMQRSAEPVQCDNDILESTGPGLFSTVYAQMAAAYPEIVVLDNSGQICQSCGGASCGLGEIARHLHRGSWRGQAPTPSAPADPSPALRALRKLRRRAQIARSLRRLWGRGAR